MLPGGPRGSGCMPVSPLSSLCPTRKAPTSHPGLPGRRRRLTPGTASPSPLPGSRGPRGFRLARSRHCCPSGRMIKSQTQRPAAPGTDTGPGGTATQPLSLQPPAHGGSGASASARSPFLVEAAERLPTGKVQAPSLRGSPGAPLPLAPPRPATWGIRTPRHWLEAQHPCGQGPRTGRWLQQGGILKCPLPPHLRTPPPT